MSDTVITTGRPMTTRLQEAIDNVGAADRERLIRVLSDPDPGSVTGPIMRGIAIELRLAQLREQAVLTGLAADLAAPDPTDPPYPTRPPMHLWMDGNGNIVDPPDGLQ